MIINKKYEKFFSKMISICLFFIIFPFLSNAQSAVEDLEKASGQKFGSTDISGKNEDRTSDKDRSSDKANNANRGSRSIKKEKIFIKHKARQQDMRRKRENYYSERKKTEINMTKANEYFSKNIEYNVDSKENYGIARSVTEINNSNSNDNNFDKKGIESNKPTKLINSNINAYRTELAKKVIVPSYPVNFSKKNYLQNLLPLIDKKTVNDYLTSLSNIKDLLNREELSNLGNNLKKTGSKIGKTANVLLSIQTDNIKSLLIDVFIPVAIVPFYVYDTGTELCKVVSGAIEEGSEIVTNPNSTMADVSEFNSKMEHDIKMAFAPDFVKYAEQIRAELNNWYDCNKNNQ